jgi:hypothetical protein
MAVKAKLILGAYCRSLVPAPVSLALLGLVPRDSKPAAA